MTQEIGFGLLLLAMALILAAAAGWYLKGDRENVRLFGASAAWPTVTGQIGSVQIVETGSSEDSNSWCEPKVNYTYRVADREYAGTRIKFSRLKHVSNKTARAAIANYAVGATVVAYDPANPQNSVLDRTAKPPAIAFWTGVMFVFAAIVLVLAVVMLSITA